MVRFLDGKTTWRTHELASSALLVDGRDYYVAFYRAAAAAKKSICLLGWQFDSDVALLRGDDLPPGARSADFELLAFLDRLCRLRPELSVRVLAWDHSVVFTFERELLQKVVFDVVTTGNLHFRWDDTVPLGGSHHQKVAIVDGHFAFAGSQDLCQSRWDDSSHRVDNPERFTRFGIHYKPYHEVQAVVAGPPARSLVELFVDRWRIATGEELDPADLVHPSGRRPDGIGVPTTLALPPARIGLSRTMPEGPGRESAREVRELLVRAIEQADHLVYVETQYLTSCAVRDALLERMRDRSRPKLDVAIVMPHKPHGLKEEVTVSMPQRLLLARIDAAAKRYGHRFGVYNVVAPHPGGSSYVYIHAKLMIVDDRFMTVGSANITNRSMTIDSELNVSWEARAGERAVTNAIRCARVRLLLEHAGGRGRVRDVVQARGLVSHLDALVDSGRSRLRKHELDHDAPSSLAKTVQEIACDILDPLEENEELGPLSRTA